MARRPVVLGWPISMALRGLGGLAGMGSTALIGGAISGGIAVGATIAAVTSTAPWLPAQTASEGSEAIPVPGSGGISSLGSLMNTIGGVLTFMDMNAQVVSITEKRRMAVISIPGRESDFLQDLGGHTAKYRVTGKFFDTDPKYLTSAAIMQTILKTFIGSGAVGSTQMLRLIMRTASPIPFMTEHEISFAVITDFTFTQIAGEPEWVNYNMTLLEFQRIPYLAKMAVLGVSNALSSYTGAGGT